MSRRGFYICGVWRGGEGGFVFHPFSFSFFFFFSLEGARTDEVDCFGGGWMDGWRDGGEEKTTDWKRRQKIIDGNEGGEEGSKGVKVIKQNKKLYDGLEQSGGYE